MKDLKAPMPSVDDASHCPVCGKRLARRYLAAHLVGHLPPEEDRWTCQHCQEERLSAAGALTHYLVSGHDPAALASADDTPDRLRSFLRAHQDGLPFDATSCKRSEETEKKAEEEESDVGQEELLELSLQDALVSSEDGASDEEDGPEPKGDSKSLGQTQLQKEEFAEPREEPCDDVELDDSFLEDISLPESSFLSSIAEAPLTPLKSSAAESIPDEVATETSNLQNIENTPKPSGKRPPKLLPSGKPFRRFRNETNRCRRKPTPELRRRRRGSRPKETEPRPSTRAPPVAPAQKAVLWDELRKIWTAEALTVRGAREDSKAEFFTRALENLGPHSHVREKSQNIATLTGLKETYVCHWLLRQRRYLLGHPSNAEREKLQRCDECGAEIGGRQAQQFHREVVHGVAKLNAPWSQQKVAAAKQVLAEVAERDYCPEWEKDGEPEATGRRTYTKKRSAVQHRPGLKRTTRTAAEREVLWELLRRELVELAARPRHEAFLEERAVAQELDMTTLNVRSWLSNRRRELAGVGYADTPTLVCEACDAKVKGKKALAFHKEHLCGL